MSKGFPDGSDSKELPAMQETWVQSLNWENPWKRGWFPTPVFLLEEFHGQRSLVGYSPWGGRVRHDWATKKEKEKKCIMHIEKIKRTRDESIQLNSHKVHTCMITTSSNKILSTPEIMASLLSKCNHYPYRFIIYECFLKPYCFVFILFF